MDEERYQRLVKALGNEMGIPTRYLLPPDTIAPEYEDYCATINEKLFTEGQCSFPDGCDGLGLDCEVSGNEDSVCTVYRNAREGRGPKVPSIEIDKPADP